MTSQALIKQYAKENLKLKEQIEKRTGKTAGQLYQERDQRARDAIELRVPDRVPFWVNVNIQAYTGIQNSAAYYDPLGWKRAMRKIAIDMEPDMCDAGLPTSGAAWETLDIKNRLWPGATLPPDYEYQFIEGEWMKADEYDMFLSDPSGFMMRRYLPRIFGALLPLTQLPPTEVMLYQGFEAMLPMFARPEFTEMGKRLAKAGKQMGDFRKTIGDSYEELALLGFPAWAPTSSGGGAGGAPFDAITAFLRGMQGSMMDMYRQPEKLLAACDLIVNRRIANAIPANPAKRGNPKRIGVPLWRGDKAFMSETQFNRFYWPGLKKALQANVDLGFCPVPFFEAEFGNRLERLLELPKGKVLASIEAVDAVRAKQILVGHTCIMVRIPLSAKVWSLREVEAYIKDLMDRCGKGGGLIVNIRIPDKAKTEDIRAMLKSIQEYSRY
jgi:hypothetical protein